MIECWRNPGFQNTVTVVMKLDINLMVKHKKSKYTELVLAYPCTFGIQFFLIMSTFDPYGKPGQNPKSNTDSAWYDLRLPCQGWGYFYSLVDKAPCCNIIDVSTNRCDFLLWAIHVSEHLHNIADSLSFSNIPCFQFH